MNEPPPLEVDRERYETITSMRVLDEWIDRIKARGFFAVDTETDSLDAISAELVGLSLATAPNEAGYIPLSHRPPRQLDDKSKPTKQLALKSVLARLRPILEDEAILKIAHHAKYDFLVLRRYGVRMSPLDDTMLLSYALDSGRASAADGAGVTFSGGGHGLDNLAFRHLGHNMISYKQLVGSGAKAISFAEVSLEEATRYSAEDADMTMRLYMILRPRLLSEKKLTLYHTLERPLIGVLAGMEEAGVKIDTKVLALLSEEFARGIKKIEREAFKEAGEEFNLGSPKQISDILFDKRQLRGGKKTKTGQWSTDVRILEDLAADGEALARIILDWRHLAKLKSTYTDALPQFVNEETKRVHSSFAMASTSTGRLSSNNPNLQNIPIRTSEGREIRRAFIAERGRRLISADYSQVELRMLAHIAGVEGLKRAFARGLDIHAATASEIFGVRLEEVDGDLRRSAKAINFGIIYGISAFGLGRQLSIPMREAGEYIDLYFRRYPEIKDYMDETKRLVRERGYVETIFGRRCHFPHIRDRSVSRRQFFERAAINAPIQGSAADLIRRAMIALPAAFLKEKLKTRMLLQVHDELVFEAPRGEVKAVSRIIHDKMIGAALPAVELSVALEVDIGVGQNWDEAH